jgi:CheY-like chemotaxis protein
MSRKKILLIEDSKTILMLERIYLVSDYDLTMAMDGRSGLQKAIAERPDLIILDLIMPGMTGLTVCRTLRREEATRQVPIVMVTSQKRAQCMDEAYRCGCNAFIRKPIDGRELVATVKSCLAG